MSTDRCEIALNAVKSALTGKSWALPTVQMDPYEVEGVTTVTVLLAEMPDSEADQHASELCAQLAGMGHSCTVDRAFRTRDAPATQMKLRITTGGDRGGL